MKKSVNGSYPLFLTSLLLFISVPFHINANVVDKSFGVKADFEVPTPIRYGSKLAGIASHSYYLSFMNGGSNKSVDYIEFGFNATAIEYQGSGSLSRGYGLLFGWTPLPLPEMVFFDNKKKLRYVFFCYNLCRVYTYL